VALARLPAMHGAQQQPRAAAPRAPVSWPRVMWGAPDLWSPSKARKANLPAPARPPARPRSFPSDTFLDELLLGNLKPTSLDAEARAALWGWDAIGPAGLLQRAYSFMGVPRKAWPGLMRLPSVCQRGAAAGARMEEFVALVRRCGERAPERPRWALGS
jgi:hypothetical protein